jgi:hypothetical protein
MNGGRKMVYKQKNPCLHWLFYRLVDEKMKFIL